MMGGFINYKWVKVYIFYLRSVVGGNTYSLYTKMGARTHSAWRYNAYMGVYNYIYTKIYA